MAGLFYAAAYTTITPGTGSGQELNGITGVIIGGTSMAGGSGLDDRHPNWRIHNVGA